MIMTKLISILLSFQLIFLPVLPAHAESTPTEEEIEKLLNETNWSTRLTEAHEKVTASYKSIDQNDPFLQSNYVKKN